MIYFNVADFVHNIDACNLRVGVECRNMRPNSRYMVMGTVYIRDAVALNTILHAVVELLASGQANAETAVAMDYVNDMSLFAWFYWTNMNNGNPQLGWGPRLPNERIRPYTPTNLLTILPEGMPYGNSLDDPEKHSDVIRQCIWNKTDLIFDNSALGIWHFGSFQNPQAKTVRDAWGAYQRMPAQEHGSEIIWKVQQLPGSPLVGLTAPTWRGGRVGSIHMHSKQLKLALSRGGSIEDPPQIRRTVKGRSVWSDAVAGSSSAGTIKSPVVLIHGLVVVCHFAYLAR